MISNRHKHLPEEVALKLDRYINLMNKISMEELESLKNGNYEDSDLNKYDVSVIHEEYKNIRCKHDIKYRYANELLKVIDGAVEGDRYKVIVNILKKLGYNQKQICHEALINPCQLSQHMKDKVLLSAPNRNKLEEYANKVAIGVIYAN